MIATHDNRSVTQYNGKFRETYLNAGTMFAISSLRVLTILASFTVFLLNPTLSSESSRPSFGSFKQIDDIVHLPTNTTFTKVSKTCEVAINIVLNSTTLSRLYLDAIGKPQSGIFLGNVAWLGSYSECTKIIHAAHYCLAYVLLNQTITIDWGICVPQECTEDDVITVLGNMIAALNSSAVKLKSPRLLFSNQGSKPAKPVYCAKPSEYTTGIIVTLVFCGFILFLVLIGTVVDVSLSFLNPRPENAVSKTDGFMPVKDRSIATDSERFPYFADDGKSHIENERTNLIHSYPESTHSSDLPAVGNAPNVVVRFFLCFSVIQNTNRIMDTKVPPGAITSINGMRVLSMWWVILGHTYGFQLIANVSNVGLVKQVLQRFTFQTVDNATFSVDSFFFLSGLLVSYLSLRQMEKKYGKFPLFKFYFHRFWRLTPAYMFVLLFYDKLTGFLGEGPIWFEMQTNPPCDKYWWTNLLYINNFYPTSEASCMGWAWYLANDMQFYVISPIIIYAAYRFRARGLLATIGILLCANFISTALIINHYDLDSVMFAQPPGNQKANFMSLVYIKPYCRIAPYLVGMLLGYVFHVKSRKIPRVYIFNVIGWCVAIVLALSTLYGEYKVLRKENPEPFNKAENITYGTFSRFAWSLALAWVIYACHHGLGGLVDNILSARFWIPLSRLTYGAYLVHIIAIGVFFGSFETVWAFSDVHSSYCFAAVVTISYAVAFILAVCVEFPMMQLEKLIFKTNR